MSSNDLPSDRIIEIESALMHLTHDVEAMQQAIVRQQREVDAIRRPSKDYKRLGKGMRGWRRKRARSGRRKTSALLKGS